jgi:hypothetical protein
VHLQPGAEHPVCVARNHLYKQNLQEGFSKSKKMRVRLTCIVGMGLLLGIVYWIAIEVRSCSILSVFFISCSEQTPPPGSSLPNTVPPLLADTSREIKQLLPQSDEDRAHSYKNIPEQDIYFLSKQDYDNFMLGLFFLFFQSLRELPSSEAKPYDAIEFLRNESMFDNDLPEELTEDI